MEMTRKLPIGIQSFEKLRNEHYLYIDKSSYVWDLLQYATPYFLSRPRRFGKSLFLSTLKAYFLGQKKLFKGLYLEKAEEEQAVLENRPAWQKYPVFYLDFNTGNYNCMETLKENLNIFLSQLEDVYGKKDIEETPSKRFEGLLKRAYQKTGKQVVILVDEYDKPLLQTMGINESLNEQYRNELKAFYSVIKTCDEYIRFAFLTGVTKFSKVSIFSDLNNLRDISLEEGYAGICGITETELKQCFPIEIQALGERQRLSYDETLAALKQYYDGYHFHPETEGVYNPFSLLNAFAKRELGSYWFSTGTPTFLVNYLKEAHYFIPDLDGNVELNESELQIYRAVAQDTLPILFQAGYLTIKEYISDLKLYRLGFPNDEVRYGFLENLLPAYSDVPFGQTGVWIGRFVQDIRKGNVEGFMERLYTACAGLPYSMAAKKNTKMRERDYQIAFYILFTLMGQFTQAEVVSVRGRSDCVVYTQSTIYVFEFKLAGSGTAQEAIEQIKEKGYAEPYRKSGKKVVLVGAIFGDGIDEDTPDTWIAEKWG